MDWRLSSLSCHFSVACTQIRQASPLPEGAENLGYGHLVALRIAAGG
jgi:hypothetical protein